ncbi:MOB kinase activator 1B [Cichlidogyrus casuarinus]|uniref:MOB kinase activator 1B n=1 Tax=Cichlidogyrus casuarinus TaxID=1844966 RepID=A0ABD2QMU2_9PLAT
MLYGTLTDFCTESKCPSMSAGPKYEYLWADGQSNKKPVKLSAPSYIETLMSWVQKQLENESIFPSKIGIPFPRDFQQVAKQILKRLFRVYAHIYYQHFNEIANSPPFKEELTFSVQEIHKIQVLNSTNYLNF